MSRLDQHVGRVRGMLALGLLVRALALAAGAWLGLVLLAILVRRLFVFQLPRETVWFWSTAAAAVIAAGAYAIIRRPSARQAAVAIDERLGLKEKFSTALYVRPSNDPFAAAAVSDAEHAASSVNLGQKFPIAYPRAFNAAMVLGVVAAATYLWLPQYNLLGSDKPTMHPIAIAAITRPAAEQIARQAIAQAESAPREVLEDEHVKMAIGEVQQTLDHPGADPAKGQQKAQDLLKEIASIKQKIDETKKFVTENAEINALKDVDAPSPEETGPVADAHRALSQGNVEQAVQELKKTVEDFDKMDQKEQEKAAEDMKKLAEDVAKKANDPEMQKQIQKQLQQAGVDQNAAKQMTSLMQQAANGDKAAAQQLQQMANQAAQQTNQQSGASPQQQKAVADAIKNAVNTAQQKSNAQAGAQQMSSATQKLASAMQNAAQQNAQNKQGAQKNQSAQANAQSKQGQGQKQGQQGQQGQQAQAQNGQGQQGQKQGQGQQGQGQQGQGQGQQAQGQQGQGQGQQAQAQGQGQQQGQQGQGPGQGQGQQAQTGGGQTAQQQMQEQMAQLDAMSKDQQAVGAQQGGNQGQGQDQGQGNGQGQQASAGQWGKGQEGQGQGQQGQGQQQQGGQGAGGVGGLRPGPVVAPFQVKKEYSESQTHEDGKIIASTFVKAPTERGESKAKMSQAIDAESKEDAGEVDPDRIPRSAQKAVRDYFDTIKQPDAGK